MVVLKGFLLIFLVQSVFSDGTLRQVNLVYRHGDRSPIMIFPTDPNQVDKWPQGLGWLSTTGMQQQYALGQWLRDRYLVSGYMNESYRNLEILVTSSDEDRCLMSAYSNLAGMYPPSAEEMFNPNITWQPIPVHTRPGIEDNMLNLGAPCPEYDVLLAETFQSPDIKKEEEENKPFYKWLGERTQWDHENISNIWRIADTLFCEKAHNMKVAPWVNDTVYDRLRKLEAYQFTLLYKGERKSRLKGGPLLRQFIDNMSSKIQNSSGVPTKMFMYSAHDSTLAALLTALGLYSGKSPQYATTVILELHQDTFGKYFVNIFHKNETYDDTAFLLTLPGCKEDCPFDDFLRLTEPVVPIDWAMECGLPSSSSSSTLSTAWIVSIALGSVLVITLVILLICLIRGRRKRSDVSYGKFGITT